MTTYTVRRGDTPYLIAQKLTGDGGRHREMLEVNADLRADTKSGWGMLRTGMQLVIPEGWELPETERQPGAVAVVGSEPPAGSRFVPEVTHVTAPEVFAALERAWARVFPEAPSQAALVCCVSQWALETGWGSQCFNFNLGNVKAEAGDGHDFTFYPCWEVLARADAHAIAKTANARADGKPGPDVVIASEDEAAGTAVVWFYPDHAGCRFRSFRSLDEGAEAYLKVLFHRFKKAWTVLNVGDPSAFASALKAYGYFTAPLDGPKGYRTALVSIFNRIQGQLASAQAA